MKTNSWACWLAAAAFAAGTLAGAAEGPRVRVAFDRAGGFTVHAFADLTASPSALVR